MLATILFDLTFQDIIAGIPRDAGAIVVFLLFAIFAAFIWVGSRSKKSLPKGHSGFQEERPTREGGAHPATGARS